VSIVIADIQYEIAIVALRAEPRSFVIEVKRPGLKDVHYSCGPQNSLTGMIGRIVSKLESDRV
jgi:hypothetical protein